MRNVGDTCVFDGNKRGNTVMEKKKDLIKEQIMVGNMTSSGGIKTGTKLPGRGPKVILSFENLRIVAFYLPESHPQYTEDTFEYHSFYKIGDLSSNAYALLGRAMDEKIFEMKYGTYRADRLTTKR